MVRAAETIDGYTPSDIRLLQVLPDNSEQALSRDKIFRSLYKGEEPYEIEDGRKTPRIARVKTLLKRLGKKDGGYVVKSKYEQDDRRLPYLERAFYKQWGKDKPPSRSLMEAIYGVTPVVSGVTVPEKPLSVVVTKELETAFWALIKPLMADNLGYEIKELPTYLQVLTQLVRTDFSSNLLDMMAANLLPVHRDISRLLDQEFGSSSSIYFDTQFSLLDGEQNSNIEILKLVFLGIIDAWKKKDENFETLDLASRHCRRFANYGIKLEQVLYRLFVQFGS